MEPDDSITPHCYVSTTLHSVFCVWQHGVAPIHLAAWFGSLEILKLLVQAGAEQKVENEVKEAQRVFLLIRDLVTNLEADTHEQEAWAYHHPPPPPPVPFSFQINFDILLLTYTAQPWNAFQNYWARICLPAHWALRNVWFVFNYTALICLVHFLLLYLICNQCPFSHLPCLVFNYWTYSC